MPAKKGNGYVTETIVAEEMVRCGCPPERFMACAAVFGNAVGAVDRTEHPMVVRFANWTAVKNRDAVAYRMSCHGGKERLPAKT